MNDTTSSIRPEVILVKVTQTCYACPSQWDAWDGVGRYYYLRYRWGVGTVTRTGRENSQSVSVTEFEFGDPMDGFISLEGFLEQTPGLTLSPTVEWG